MIKYSEAEPLDVLSSPAKDNYDVIAISYAIKMATAKLIAFAASIRLYGDIDSLSEEILDLLALELQTQYYSESLDIDTKRALIKNTLLWYMNAGTVQTLKEFAEIVFGESEITEWFDYDGDEYYFKIVTDTTWTADMFEQVSKMIGLVKNTRSHLESVTAKKSISSSALVTSNTSYYTLAPAIHEATVIESEIDSVSYANTVTSGYTVSRIYEAVDIENEATAKVLYGMTAAAVTYAPAVYETT